MKFYITLLIIIQSSLAFSQVQNDKISKQLSLEEVLQIASEQSVDAIRAKHSFRADYWSFRSFKATYKPGLSLSSTLPNYSRSIKMYENPDGTESPITKDDVKTSANLSLSQNIGFTGGRVYASSDLRWQENLSLDKDSQDRTVFTTTPIQVGFVQPIFKYNSFKWEKRIEPLKFEEAKKEYIQALEDVNIRASGYFFDLALAQKNLEIADLNYFNTDTLFRIAEGRYNIGTIAENELLQMELSNLQAGIALNDARIALEMKKFKLRSYLGYNDKVELIINIPDSVPSIEINVDNALSKAYANNPEIIAFERRLIEAESSVARAKANKGLNADLRASYGLSQSATNINDAYIDPQVSQSVQLGVNLPIVDWGLGKGNYKMAQSNRELVRTNIAQAKIDFDQDLILKILQFNVQDEQVNISDKANLIARNRYNITKQRFLIGKIDALDLNDSQKSKDNSERQYISSLKNYWNYFFNMRKLTLHDFINDEELRADFDLLID